MSHRTRMLHFAAGLVLLGATAAGCGNPEVKVDYAGAEAPSEGAVVIPEAMANMRTPEEQQGMVDAARITAEAMRTRKLPPPDQMAKLPPEQQEALRRALESMGATP